MIESTAQTNYKFKAFVRFLNVVGNTIGLVGVVLGVYEYFKYHELNGAGFWLLALWFFMNLWAQKLREYYEPSA